MTAGQLDQIMKKGRVFHSSLFVVRTIDGQNDTRIAAIAPQKIFKTATFRNSLRRKMYEAAKAVIDELPPSIHIAVFAKQVVQDKSVSDMSSDMKSIFVKAGILR